MSNSPKIWTPSLKSLRSSAKRSPPSLETNRSHFLKLLLGPTHKSESFVDNRWSGSGGPKRKPSKTRTRWSSSVNTRSQTWWRWWKSTRSARRSYADVVHLNNVVATSVVVFLSSRTSMIGSSKVRKRSSARTRRERRRLLHTCSRWYGADRPAQVLANGSVINCCT